MLRYHASVVKIAILLRYSNSQPTCVMCCLQPSLQGQPYVEQIPPAHLPMSCTLPLFVVFAD